MSGVPARQGAEKGDGGKVVGAASTFDAARNLVQRLENMPEYYLVFPAAVEPDFDLVYDLLGSGQEMPQVCWSANPRGAR